MNKSEFQTNMTGAESFRTLSPETAEQDFWTGYQRGLRRNYHGEKFGTADEHKLWLSLADEPHDTSRKMRGLGYRAGFDGHNIQQAMKTLASRQYLSELGKRGGSSTSPAKSRASAENGKLGGRPRKKIDIPD